MIVQSEPDRYMNGRVPLPHACVTQVVCKEFRTVVEESLVVGKEALVEVLEQVASAQDLVLWAL